MGRRINFTTDPTWPKGLSYPATVMLTAAAATCERVKEAGTRSFYCDLRTIDGRGATIRDANHMIHHQWIGFGPIPRLNSGATINIGDYRQECGLKLLAVFLGWPADQVRRLKLGTQRDLAALLEIPRLEEAEQNA